MANLLPEQYLKLVKSERHTRVVIVFLLGITTTVLLGSVFLMPSLILSQSKALDAELSLEVARQLTAQQEGGGVLTEIRRTRSQVERLGDELSKIKVENILRAIEESASADIDLASIAYTRAIDSPGKIGISGIAKTREGLLTFTRQLEQHELFAEINLPVSNLAQSIDIGFSIDFQVSESNKPINTRVRERSVENDPSS